MALAGAALYGQVKNWDDTWDKLTRWGEGATEYERIAIYSQGTFTQNDYIVGLLVFLLVMEL